MADFGLQDAYLAEGDEHGVANDHADDTDAQSCLHHVGLLDKASGVGDGIRWGGDRE